MSLLYQLYGDLPGFNADLTTHEAEVTWGKTEWNDSFLRPIILDGASRDTSNSPTTIIRAGMILAFNATTKKARPWIDLDATYGKIGAILLFDVDTQQYSADADKFVGAGLFGGNLKSRKLIIEVDGTPGSLTANARTGLKAVPFLLDDEPFVA